MTPLYRDINQWRRDVDTLFPGRGKILIFPGQRHFSHPLFLYARGNRDCFSNAHLRMIVRTRTTYSACFCTTMGTRRAVIKGRRKEERGAASRIENTRDW